MGLQRQTDSNAVYLAAKHFCLWQELKQPREGSVSVEVTNPETKQVITKHGFRNKTVEGRAVKMEPYKREHAGKKYIGYKLHLQDGPDLFVLDFPYESIFLRNFLKVAPNVDWTKPLSISVFKGKDDDGEPQQSYWFRQKVGDDYQTLKWAFTREHPNGQPEPVKNARTDKWDFSTQQEWLVDKLDNETIPAIMEAAKTLTVPTPHASAEAEPEPGDEGDMTEVRQGRAMPTNSAASDNPRLSNYLNRASLSKANAGKVIDEICQELYKHGSELAQAAWVAADPEHATDEAMIRSLFEALKKAEARA